MKSLVYIIVLNWNGGEDTFCCVKSLLSLNYSNFVIVICDNNSTDDSYGYIKQSITSKEIKDQHAGLIEIARSDSIKEPAVEQRNARAIYLLQTGNNLGYAGGNNRGLEFAIADENMAFAWVLNNDTEVDKDALAHLVNKMHGNPQMGMCGSKLMYFDERSRPQANGGIYNPWLGTTKHYIAKSSPNDNIKDGGIKGSINYIVGASVLIRRKTLTSVGLFAEEYFLYYEDVDYSIRVARSGLQLGFCSESIVYHKEAASTKKAKSEFIDYLSMRNRLLLTKKLFPKKKWVVKLSMLAVLLHRILKAKFLSVPAVFKVLSENC